MAEQDHPDERYSGRVEPEHRVDPNEIEQPDAEEKAPSAGSKANLSSHEINEEAFRFVTRVSAAVVGAAAIAVAVVNARTGFVGEIADRREEIGGALTVVSMASLSSDKVKGGWKKATRVGLLAGLLTLAPEIVDVTRGVADGLSSLTDEDAATTTTTQPAAPGTVDAGDHTITITLPRTLAEAPGWVCVDTPPHTIDGDDGSVINIAGEQQHLTGQQLIAAAPPVGEGVVDLIHTGQRVDFNCAA